MRAFARGPGPQPLLALPAARTASTRSHSAGVTTKPRDSNTDVSGNFHQLMSHEGELFIDCVVWGRKG